jgi:heptosyltransferase II
MQLPQDIKHLAILMPSWVGDVVMASCVWKLARKKYPSAKITAVIRPHLAPLLEGIQDFDAVLSLDMKTSVFKAAKELKHIQADAIILLPNSFRAATIARLANIQFRCGYARDRRSWLLTNRVQVTQQNEPTPTSDYYLRLANIAFGMSETSTLPSFVTQGPAETILSGYAKPIVLLVAGASKPEKRWDPVSFAIVADALSNIGATCCAIGSPDEHELVQKIVAAANSPIHDLTRSGVTLSTLQSVIAHADLMITNDTGPRHLAVACGTPTITLFGPTDYRWTKYDCGHDIALLADPFLPEHLVADSNPQRCSINNIPPSDVIETAKRIIS